MSGTTSPFSAIYAFGDSLSDAGNASIATALTGATPVSPPYFHTNYSVAGGLGSQAASVFSNGPVWVQDLSIGLGLGTLKPSLLGGNDYAYGGAQTGATPQNSGNTTVAATSLPAQLAQFTGSIAPTALVTMSIGSNDVLAILANSTLTPAQQVTDVADAVANELAAIHSLAKSGGRNFLVFNVPNLGLIPEVTLGLVNGSNTPSAALDNLATSLSASYDAQLAAALGTEAVADNASIRVLNGSALIAEAAADPAVFGLTNTTTPVWSGNFASSTSGTLAATTLAAQNQYLFWDDYHPTASVHSVIANTAQLLLEPSAAREDFFGVRTSEVLLTSASSGLVIDWQLTGGSYSGSAVIAGESAGWSVAGTGDFNGDGTSDILFQNASSGLLLDWTLRSGSYVASTPIAAVPAGFGVIGTGDFNGDGTSDILLQNPTTGLLVDWQMSSGALVSSTPIAGAGSDWKEVGTGDFNGDGTSDILFQNLNSGLVLDWQMSNGGFLRAVPIAGATPGWNAVGTGDFNGDGTSDILFQNAGSGALLDWQMTAGAFASSNLLGVATPDWKFAGVGDYNGDGTSDVLFQNIGSGQLLYWQVNSSTFTKAVTLAVATPDLQVH